ncbi:hypothetical protein SARC_07435 [Sphaeroforma arctica JP610]|uniref:ENTH domain-containing protein n=1 Tax=Sphaeroforma arctica JP610 TaxID=667725 RepID=A0A0L0FTQ9_9EUKA|nr:hypothetical protein SARC_07435 [Sphaeroforma arctica JP610]KNC80192.1 hypothetical protein SARC_07435 [Sphaeroforma arctica JP610]|eukprot:XP_014154094.1 hypothetical protein SARC_07435 [Sphaeroforma arctica JP610]
MPPVKDEMKAEKRELKQIGATAAAKMVGQHTRAAVIKATNTDLLPPKRKHINYLLDYMYQGGSIDKVVSTLFERTREKNWIVAMKSLAVFHTLMKECRRGFMRCMASRPTNFRHMYNFLDKLNNEGFEMSWFIRKYAMYLEEKVATCREYGVDYVHHNSAASYAPLDNNQLCKAVAAIQVQLQVLLDVQIPFEEVTNAVQKNAYMIIMRECVRLYVSLNTGVITILERFFKMSKSQAENALRIYENFLLNISAVSSFLLIGSRIDVSMSAEIPALKSPPVTLIDSLRKYVGEEAPAVAEYTPRSESLFKTNSNIARQAPGFQPIYHGQTSSSIKPAVRSAASDSAKTQPSRKADYALANVSTVAKPAVAEVNLLDFDDGPSTGTSSNPYATTDAFSVSVSTNNPGGLPSDLFGPISSGNQELHSAPAQGDGHQQQMFNGQAQGYYNAGMNTDANYNTNTMQQGMGGGGYNSMRQQQPSYGMQQGGTQNGINSNRSSFDQFTSRSSYDQNQNQSSYDQNQNGESNDQNNPFAMTVAVQQNDPMQQAMGMYDQKQQYMGMGGGGVQQPMGAYQHQPLGMNPRPNGMQQIQNGMQQMQMGQNYQQQDQQPMQNNNNNYQNDPFSGAVARSNNPFD